MFNLKFLIILLNFFLTSVVIADSPFFLNKNKNETTVPKVKTVSPEAFQARTNEYAKENNKTLFATKPNSLPKITGPIKETNPEQTPPTIHDDHEDKNLPAQNDTKTKTPPPVSTTTTKSPENQVSAPTSSSSDVYTGFQNNKIKTPNHSNNQLKLEY